MLSPRLRSFQAELHTHRHWLAGFLQRTQTSSFSITSNQRYAALHKQSERRNEGDGRLPTKAAKQKSKPSPASLRYKKTVLRRDKPDKPEVNPIIQDIRDKGRQGNIAHVIENYSALNERDKGTLDSRDVRHITQVLHYSVRKEKSNHVNQHRQSQVRQLVEFAEVIVNDIRKERIAPSGRAHVHLIGIFKESGSLEKGVQFWKWLVDRDETYVDVDCYGSAIELLAVDGTPLAELERLYQEALTRFPGSFAAYHLSPDAVLPNRELPFTVGGIPISLLQGILTARLLHGDTRNAYLALDTALRILPDQVPQRLFWLFLEERPLEEAYAVFALACRGGNTVSGAYYRSMLGAIRIHSSLRSPAEHALGVRAMLSVTHLFIGSGGTVANNSVNELVIAATQFLRVKGVAALPAQEKRNIVKAVMELVRGLFKIFARYGAKPGIPAFNSIITNLGGFGSSKQTIGIALKDADALGLSPTDVTWRSILAVGGMFQDKSLVEKTWAHLRDSRIENEENPRASDFHAMVKPAHLAGAVEYAQEELDKFRDVLGATEYETILSRLEDPMEAEAHSIENVEPVGVDDVIREIDMVKGDIEVINDRTGNSPTVQDFSEQILPMTLQPLLSSSLDLPDVQLRKIYDAFTTIPDTTPSAATPSDSFFRAESEDPPPQPAPAKSKTNVSFGDLRFSNWKAINSLLELAEKNDAAYLQQVDEAIAAGKRAPKRISGLIGVAGEGRRVVSWGLGSVGLGSGKGEDEAGEVGKEGLAEVRREIGRLRGRGS